jgi:hypothetical protein
MTYVRRIDGFDALHAAHRDDALGGVDGLVRDRSVPANQPTEVVCWVSDLRPGDEVIDAATYRFAATRLLEVSYRQYFVPVADAREARMLAASLAFEQEEATALAAIPPAMQAAFRLALDSPHRLRAKERLLSLYTQAAEHRLEMLAERTALQEDIAAGRHAMGRLNREVRDES